MAKTEQRRAEIVDGLKRIMAERGYERASVAAIARAAGLAPGLVHYHFPSKQAILLALVERVAETFRRRFEARLAGAGDAWARLDAFIDATTALGEDADPDAVACWTQIGAEAQRIEEVRALFGAATARQLDTLTALVAAVGPDGDPGTLAVGLLAAIEGAFRLATAAPGVMPPGAAAPMLRRMARGLLGAPT